MSVVFWAQTSWSSGDTPPGRYNLYCPLATGTLYFNTNAFDVALKASTLDDLWVKYETLLVEDIPTCHACLRITFQFPEEPTTVYQADLFYKIIKVGQERDRIYGPAEYILKVYVTDTDEEPRREIIGARPCYENSHY